MNFRLQKAGALLSWEMNVNSFSKRLDACCVLDSVTATTEHENLLTLSQSGLEAPFCDNVTGVEYARSFARQTHSSK